MLNIDGDDVDPRMERVVQTLGAKLETFRGAFITPQTIDAVNRLVKDHRATWRLRGVDVPKMVAVVLPTTGAVEILRQDLDVAGIQAAVVGLVKKYPSAGCEEIAAAFLRAFPDYVTRLQSQKALQMKGVN